MRTSRVSQDAALSAVVPRLESNATSESLGTKDASRKPTRRIRSRNLTDDHTAASSSEGLRKRKRSQLGPSPRRVSSNKSTTQLVDASVKSRIDRANDIPGGYSSKTTSLDSQTLASSAAHKVNIIEGEVTIHPPRNWHDVYDTVKAMRSEIIAPVDTMGCERLAQRHLTPKEQRFQTLVALMLSSQTRDTVTAAVMVNLQEGLPSPGLVLGSILTVSEERLNKLLFPVGFHNNKTKFLKRMATILETKYAGDIPDTVEGLMALPGVGPKMAYLCMTAAWGRIEGIGVDVHVHRITNLWGWQRPPSNNPEATRKSLQAWLPKELWGEINALLVGFGQTICTPVGRKCGECEIGKKALCPGMVRSSKGRKKAVILAEGTGSPAKVSNLARDDANKEEMLPKHEDLKDLSVVASMPRRSRRKVSQNC
ncbi:MAG: hypothetical protein M1825_001429 [Sarcosagium campestre]|nr:MAG: hypothetical protein M1825_001429 [Sarcosagium campestre]